MGKVTKLVGRADTPEQKLLKAQRVAKLLIGDLSKGVEPCNIAQVKEIMNFGSRTSVYTYIELAKEKGFIELDENNKAILPKPTALGKFKKFTKENPISTSMFFSEYAKDQLGRKTAKAQVNINHLTNLFNTLEVTPEYFIHQGQVDKKNVVRFRNDMLDHFDNGTNLKQKAIKNGKRNIFRLGLNYAIASFCGGHSISWIRGDPDMDRQVVEHGLYSHIRLNNLELGKADTWIKKEFGMDSDLFRVFWVGVQSCSRKDALLTMPLNFTVDTPTLLVTKCHESKTAKAHPEMWDNFIKRKDSMSSLRDLKAKDSIRIYDTNPTENNNKNKVGDRLANELKELYLALGKNPDLDHYYFDKPFHVLRHIGAHYLLSFSNYTAHSLVAKLGHWLTASELEKSYGSIPPEMIDQELEKYNFNKELI